jgi:hypothetical protein
MEIFFNKGEILVVQNSPNNLVHNGKNTRATSRQGKETHKGDTNKLPMWHHLDSKATQSNQREGTRTTTTTRTLYEWMGKTPIGHR